ncbi:MAG: HlyD family type I secretion periplasmic adaptor subunit [Paracoccaceae bacterium]|nr:HlyD family type I secretion periplasmic adaptor subunit [Paracoccaceae bacterium]
MAKYLNQFMIALLLGLLAAGYFWAKHTQLDLITRGEGRLIAEGQNKLVQAPDGGIVTKIFVNEGDIVSNNQLLAVINSTAAEGSLKEIKAKKNSLLAKLVRLDAELKNSSKNQLAKSLDGFAENVRESQLALFLANRSNLRSLLFSIESERDQLEKSLATIKEQLSGAKELLILVNEENKELSPLIKAGALGASEKFRLKRERAQLTSEIHVLEAKVLETDAGYLKLEAEIEALQSGYERNIFEERATYVNELSEIDTRIPLLEQKLKQTEIRSPSDGIINSLPVSDEETVIKTGEIIAEIVPSADDLIVEAFIDPKDIAKIEVGQKARVSLTAYDAAKYGYLTGRLLKVSADAVYREEKQSYMYAIEVELIDNLIDSIGDTVPLNPGMIAQVDIIRGQQTVLEYFWQPIAKLKDDAFRQ